MGKDKFPASNLPSCRCCWFFYFILFLEKWENQIRSVQCLHLTQRCLLDEGTFIYLSEDTHMYVYVYMYTYPERMEQREENKWRMSKITSLQWVFFFSFFLKFLIIWELGRQQVSLLGSVWWRGCFWGYLCKYENNIY